MRSVFSLSFYMYASLCETRKEQLILISPENRGTKKWHKRIYGRRGKKNFPTSGDGGRKEIFHLPANHSFPFFSFSVPDGIEGVEEKNLTYIRTGKRPLSGH